MEGEGEGERANNKTRNFTRAVSFPADFIEERRQLLEVIGPDLHNQLDSLGIEVEMVDIHYGTQYNAAFDSELLEFQKKEIHHCFQVSRGCFLMVSPEIVIDSR